MAWKLSQICLAARIRFTSWEMGPDVSLPIHDAHSSQVSSAFTGSRLQRALLRVVDDAARAALLARLGAELLEHPLLGLRLAVERWPDRLAAVELDQAPGVLVRREARPLLLVVRPPPLACSGEFGALDRGKLGDITWLS
jgi:hypothetical protein